MAKHIHIPVLVVFCIVTFILVSATIGVRVSNSPEMQIAIKLITTTLGTLIALLSALFLLLRAAVGVGFRDLLPLTLPLLAGLLITSFHWAVALVLGLIAISLFVREMVGTPAERAAVAANRPTSESTRND